MPTRPDDPSDLAAYLRDIDKRLTAKERERLTLPDGALPLQTFEDGSPLGATRFLDFGAGLSATLVGDDYIQVTGGGGGREYATVVVASSTSHQDGKDRANFLCTGTNDHLVISQAINSLPSPGGRVVLLEGIYNCPVIVDVTRTDVFLQGMGSATVINGTAGNSGFRTIGAADRLVIASMKLEDCVIGFQSGSSGKHLAYDLWMTGAFGISISASDSRVVGCRFDNDLVESPLVGGIINTTAADTLIEGCLFTNNSASARAIFQQGANGRIVNNSFSSWTEAIRLGSGSTAGEKCLVEGNQFNNCGASAVGAIVPIVSGHVVQGNWFSNCGPALGPTSGGVFTGTVLFLNNQIIDPDGLGTRIGSSGSICAGNLIRQTSVGTAGDGIHVSSGPVLVSNNHIVDVGGHGILVSPTVASITNSSIQDNVIRQASRQTDITFDGIHLAGTLARINVQGNLVRTASSGNRLRYGVNVSAATITDSTIANNELQLSGITGCINDAGTATAKWGNRCTNAATFESGGGYTSGGVAAPSGHVIEDEGTPLTQRANLNFVGDGVTVTDATPDTVVTIPAGAPSTADYLVGTANASLSAEIVVGTTPGGELGNTWASPTVDATHSGSSHTDFIAKAFLDAKGDLVSASANDTPVILGVGANGTAVVADSATASGLKYGTPAVLNFAAATTLGTVVGKVEIFDGAGVSLGFLPVYDAIT